MKLPAALALCIFSLLAHGQSEADDVFEERLDLRPLPDGKLSATFRFLTRAKLQGEQWGSNVEFYPSRLFPRSIASILRAYAVNELHLSLAAGRWEYDRWQWPSLNGSATGAEVWAWLTPLEQECASADRLTAYFYCVHSVDKQWSGLASTLGGLFCTSLNRLDASRTTAPALTFRPEGASLDGAVLRRGILPLEKPCTENLTPFMALLPCRSSAGLAQLLKPHRMFDSDWQKLSIKVSRLEDGRHELDLGVDIVFDPVRVDRMKGGEGSRDWSFESLFERVITRGCPAATTSDIVLHVSDKTTQSLVAEAGWNAQGDELPFTAVLAHSEYPIDARMHYTKSSLLEAQFQYPSTFVPCPVSITRTFAGYGQERGIIGVEILNAQYAQVEAIWVEEWPWWLKAYLSTLTSHISPFGSDRSRKEDVVTSLHYTPARDRERPTLLEAKLLLPPRSRVELSLRYAKAFLRYTEYAPDANRGFDVPAASLHLVKQKKRIYTTSGLIPMPTPDFSMPYNVCVLTSTVVALFFGTVFNHLCRVMRLVRLNDKPKGD